MVARKVVKLAEKMVRKKVVRKVALKVVKWAALMVE